jgi:hypothetical protein
MELARNPVPGSDRDDLAVDQLRIRQLAAVYLMLFCVALPGLWLIVKGGWPLIVVAHRSPTQTLSLAFFVTLFVYVASLALRGAWRAARLGVFVLRASRRPRNR